MKTAMLLSVLTLGFLVLGDSIVPAQPLNYEGPTAERPTLTPGDVWMWEFKTAWGRNAASISPDNNPPQVRARTFIGKEDEHLVFRSGRRGELLIYTDLDLEFLKMVNSETGAVVARKPIEVYQQEISCLRFPQWIGKQWELRYQVPGWSLTDVLFTIDMTCKVESVEDVEVKAGKFTTFKIRRDWVNKDQRIGFNGGHSIQWYSPNVKNVVKYFNEYYRGTGGVEKKW